MLSYYKKQEILQERMQRELKARAGKPAKFDFRSAEELRADWSKEKSNTVKKNELAQ